MYLVPRTLSIDLSLRRTIPVYTLDLSVKVPASKWYYLKLLVTDRPCSPPTAKLRLSSLTVRNLPHRALLLGRSLARIASLSGPIDDQRFGYTFAIRL